ncbi:MAG: hypothetical protein JWR06_1592 [Jatrophihabitans sp.]|nr:hypothetical protein [Jatrophihabitans sp.]
MPIVDVSDLDWYIDNVVVPSGIEGRAVGPVLAWQGSWNALAHQVRTQADNGLGDASRQALGQGFVLTRTQTRACGVADATVRRLIRRGTWTACGHGTVAVVPIASGSDLASERDALRRTHCLRAAAAAVRRRGHVVSANSAAAVHGLPLLGLPALPELAAAAPATFGRRSTALVRVADLAPDALDDWFGVPITTTARTIVDVARFDSRSGLMAADAALRERIVTRDQLEAALEMCSTRPGVRRARHVISLASPLAESPLESITRLVLHDAGFAAPELQVELTGSNGRAYRVDFVWPQLKLVLEADGRTKYREDELWQENRREVALVRAGYRVVRVTWSDVLAEWPVTCEWLRGLMHSLATNPLS